MGLDANLACLAIDLSTDEGRAIHSFISDHRMVVEVKTLNVNGIEVTVVPLYYRYYGPTYRRGPWPTLRVLAAILKDHTGGPVWYYDDGLTHEEGLSSPRKELTEERIAEIDAIWEAQGYG